MALIVTFIIVVFIAICAIPLVSVNGKGIIAVTAIVLNVIISSIFAIQALSISNVEFTLSGSIVTGDIPLRIDALSAWFMLTINFTILTGSFYGLNYMKVYRKQTANISMHAIAFILVYAALIGICVIQNS